MENSRRLYLYFWVFGLVNNVLYVVILSAAADIVGPSSPKSLVLLANILPSFLVKLSSPFFIHKVPYGWRVVSLIVMSCLGMSLVSFGKVVICLVGIMLASISSGFGEVTFLQLTHRYGSVSLNGWSSGTGGAGLVGSGVYMLLTSILHLPIQLSLFVFSILPFVFLIYFQLDNQPYQRLDGDDNSPTFNTAIVPPQYTWKADVIPGSPFWTRLKAHVVVTSQQLKVLIVPYMLPLTSVYFFEYMINQAVAPTLLFSLDGPHLPFFFHKYRDMYVTYGTLYQIGVFIARSVGHLFRIRNLYFISILQGINFMNALTQSWFYYIHEPYLIMALIFYEGFLGGLSYVNTFLNILENVDPNESEFALGAVSIADSFGILLAALCGLFLEPALCKHQIKDDRPWCSLE